MHDQEKHDEVKGYAGNFISHQGSKICGRYANNAGEKDGKDKTKHNY